MSALLSHVTEGLAEHRIRHSERCGNQYHRATMIHGYGVVSFGEDHRHLRHADREIRSRKMRNREGPHHCHED
jgi:hypothetical protein